MNENKQKIQLLIKAKNETEAINFLNGLNLNHKIENKESIPNTNYIIDLILHKELKDNDYEQIKNKKEIAILQDSYSKERAIIMLEKIYFVEERLKALIKYAPLDSIELFDNISRLKSKNKIKQYNNDIVAKNESQTIYNYLTLGEMIEFFGTNLHPKDTDTIQWKNLYDILNHSENFNEFRTKLIAKHQSCFVWDIISKKVLLHHQNWDKIKSLLEKIKSYRNHAAHFHIITEENKVKFLTLSDDFLHKTKMKKYINTETKEAINQELTSLTYIITNNAQNVINNIASNLPSYIEQISLPNLNIEKIISDYTQALTHNQFQNIFETAHSHVMNFLKEGNLASLYQESINRTRELTKGLTDNSLGISKQ